MIKLCSVDCRLARSRRKQIHKNGRLVRCTCERCGGEYKVRPSVAKVQRFCSQACSSKTIAKRFRGENSPVWKKKTAINCAYCSKAIHVQPSRLGRKKYCSVKCRTIGNLQRLAQNPRTDIEIAMAQQLNDLKITYQEQVLFFDKFLVDFFIPSHNLIIQCDGLYWHDRPEAKARDKGQDNYFAKCGYSVLRFTDKQIYKDINECGNKILSTIKELQSQQSSDT